MKSKYVRLCLIAFDWNDAPNEVMFGQSHSWRKCQLNNSFVEEKNNVNISSNYIFEIIYAITFLLCHFCGIYTAITL